MVEIRGNRNEIRGEPTEFFYDDSGPRQDDGVLDADDVHDRFHAECESVVGVRARVGGGGE